MKITLKQAVVAASFFQYAAASITMHKIIKQIPGNKILKSIGANAIDGVIAYPYMKELQEIMLSEDSMWDACIEIPGPKDLVKKVSNMMSKIALKQLEESSDDDDEDEDEDDDFDDDDEDDDSDDDNDDSHGKSITFFSSSDGLHSINIIDDESIIKVYADPTLNNDIGEYPEESINGTWEWLRYLRPDVVVNTHTVEEFLAKNNNFIGQYFAVLSEEVVDGVDQYKVGVYNFTDVVNVDTVNRDIKQIDLNEELVKAINGLVLRNSSLKPFAYC